MIFSKIRKIIGAKKMTEETVGIDADKEKCVNPNVTVKKKRDIFRFNGDKDISINLEHVTSMYLEGKRITFQFYATSTFIDLENEEAGKKAYEQILGIWSVDNIE